MPRLHTCFKLRNFLKKYESVSNHKRIITHSFYGHFHGWTSYRCCVIITYDPTQQSLRQRWRLKFSKQMNISTSVWYYPCLSEQELEKLAEAIVFRLKKKKTKTGNGKKQGNPSSGHVKYACSFCLQDLHH